MKNALRLTETFSVKPSIIYNTWLSSEGHSKMTGGEANISDNEGETYMAWNEYIWGVNKSLTKNKEIIQTWRSTEFEKSDADSLVTIELKETEEGCELSLLHTKIPEGQVERYKSGWVEHYFKPMHEYFKTL